MTTAAQPEVNRATGTRIASYLLVEYLERIGVEVIFGLCGHTNIACSMRSARAASASSPAATSRSPRTRPTATRASPASQASC